MFTVLIAEKEHIDAIRQVNRLFFEPFLENKDLAFCCWNPRGQTFSEAVPGLADLIGRRKNWRAVIINSASEAQLKQQNPFDLVDFSVQKSLIKPPAEPENNEAWNSWEQQWRDYYAELAEAKQKIFKNALELPLSKLATWLCFRPSDFVLEDVAEKKDAHDWAMMRLETGEEKPSSRLEKMELEQYRCELRLKERLRREFTSCRSINIQHPQEVYCISQRITENGFFSPEFYWNIRNEEEYSEFADRNMYYDKMRFMVFDILPATHQDYRCDRIRFLYAAMIFASNAVPGSAMQARRLYRLNSENDDTPLCTLVTSYEKKLTLTLDSIENEIEKIRSEIPGELSDHEAEALFCAPAEIAVLPERAGDAAELRLRQRFGLASDRPQNESAVWKKESAAAQKKLEQIAKKQNRAIKKGVEKMRIMTEVPHAEISRLNALQMEDIREYTQNAEDAMVSSIPPDLEDLSRHSEELQKKKAAVRDVMNRRMKKKTELTLTGVCLGLYLICFLPFLFSNIGSAEAFSTAALLTAAMLVLLGLILLAALFCFRIPLVNAAKDFNAQMHSAYESILSAMQKYSGHISAVCNVRRGYEVLNYSKENPDIYTKSIRIRKKHQEDLKKKRAYLIEEYKEFIGGPNYCDYAMAQPYGYDFNQETEYKYPAPFLAGDRRQIEFLESGNFVTVPSGYVTRMSVRLEEIYDK